jgi:hypothetical protein
MKRAKQKTPKKKMRNKRAIYSLARKKKGKTDLQCARGRHTTGGNGVLHEDATAYHTHFTTVLDAATPRVGESIFMCPQPDDAKQQQTGHDESVRQPINAAMLPIQLHRTNGPKPALFVKRQSGNEKQHSADYARSQSQTIECADVGGMQFCNDWQQHARQHHYAGNHEKHAPVRRNIPI